MEKIISLFKRNYDGDRLVYDEVVPGAEWVLAGEGVATQKLDGTCCKFEGSKLWKRYTLKKGRTPPAEYVPATDVDPVTGKQEGWVPVGDGRDNQYHLEGWGNLSSHEILDGTYELCGPRIQSNPEQLDSHQLLLHGSRKYVGEPRDFEGIKAWLATRDVEGIVWHHPDGRMVKIKTRDFGLSRKRGAE
jgi:hypothetical protein